MATEILPVTGPRVWCGADLAGRNDWTFHLPADVLAALDAVVRDAAARGLTQENFDFESVAIPGLRQALAPVVDELAHGAGLALLRGIEVERHGVEALKLALLVIGNHMGLVGPQERKPKGIGEVMDIQPPTREYYYHGGGPLPMHMDPVDVVGLLCVRGAMRGGESRIVSAMQVHNEILRARPDLLKLLYRGYRHQRREYRRVNGAPALTEYFCPVFAEIGGENVCNYIPRPIRMAVEEGLMTLSPAEEEALALLDATAAREDLCLAMEFVPGDIQFLNNRATLHGRADYRDFADPDRRRLLLRLWLTMPGWVKYPTHLPHTDVELQTEPA